MKTKFLLLVTTGLLIFTISAFSLTLTTKNVALLPFAVLGLALTLTFKNQLKKVR